LPPFTAFAFNVVVVPLQGIDPAFILADMFTPLQIEGGELGLQSNTISLLVFVQPRESVTVTV
jgi:hypothetical protein